MIAKRYLSGGINSGTFAYNNTTPVVGNTTAFDPVGNKFYERALHAEDRSFLYQPVDNTGNVASPIPGYDSTNRLLQFQRGTLNSTGGYQNAGGGSVASSSSLPNADLSRSYDLDGLGNWRSSDYVPYPNYPGLEEQRNHNRLNQITQRTPGAGHTETFAYDGLPGSSNGNLSNDGTYSYQCDALNRLIQVGTPGPLVTPILQFAYDAFGRRVQKLVISSFVPTNYLYLGNQCVEERNPAGGSGSTDTPIRQYVWGTYIDECIQLTTLEPLGPQSLPAGAYYLLQDLLYRAVALTNATGGIVEAYDTDAYGNTLIFTGPGTDGVWFTDDDVQSSYGANDIIYCGYRFDPETELYYVRARTYNPTLGRWIQRDPIGYAGGVNLYEYVGGQPAVAMDPRGTDVQTACQSRCWQTCGGNDSPACQNCITCCEFAGEDPTGAAKCFPPPPPPPGPHPFGCGCSKGLCEQRCGEIQAGAILACAAGCAIGCFWARGGYGRCFLACDGICTLAVGNAGAVCTAGCAACPNP